MRYATERRKGVVSRFIGALGPRALFLWGLLVLMTYSMMSSLSNVVPNLDISFTFTVAAAGLTLGWLLAQLPMKAGLAAMLSLVLGVEFLLIHVGNLGSRLVQIAATVVSAVEQTAVWYWTEQPPNWEAVSALYLQLWRDIAVLLERTFDWLWRLYVGRGGFDVIGAALVWGFGIWVCYVWAGWVARRHHRPLLALLPASLVLSFVLSYTGSNPYVFLPIIGITLLLMSLIQQNAREIRWNRLGIDFSRGIWTDLAMVATGLSIALVLAAAIAPSISAQRIADWVRDVTDRGRDGRTEAVAEGLGLTQQPAPRPSQPTDPYRSTSLPQRHLLGSGPELSRVVVMVIETGELPSLPPDEFLTQSAPRHYWRSLTYDRYLGRGWATSATETYDYDAGEPIVDLDAPHLRQLRQSVRLVGQQGGRVHVRGTLVSVDQDFQAAWRSNDELFAATVEEQQYTADSVYPIVTEEELRAASRDYPDWLLGRYLQLPGTVPDRVKALSRDLTAVEPTPYDRAVAIEQYLREFPYNLDVPAPGAQDDIADYFLFELQEGYCDYYATAMVVLARAAGLPARMVIGYASGDYDPVDARYVVTEANAHAWPEVYFPGYGWIEFEPTGGLAPIRRPTAENGPMWPDAASPGPLVQPREAPSLQVQVAMWGLVGLVGLLLMVGVLTALDGVRMLLLTPEELLKRFYRRLQAKADRLGISRHPGDTPRELALAYADQLSVIAAAHGSVGTKLVKPAIEDVQTLLGLYQRVWYSPRSELSSQERRRAILTWLLLRWRVWLARLWRRSANQGREPRPEFQPAGGD